MPHQNQTLKNTLVSYTRDAAYSEFQDHQKGQIREGYLADLVMLPQDFFEINPEEIAAMKPSLTMVDGRVVYEA